MRPRLDCMAVLMALALQGCSLAPTYHTPSTPLPATYHEDTAEGPWKAAQPADHLQPQWWVVFNDPTLNQLQQRLLSANPNLAAALAHYEAAVAYAGQIRGGLFPTVTGSLQPMRQRQSENKPLRGSGQPNVYNSDTAAFNLSFDLDLWGRIRNQVAAGDAQAQASADDLGGARLSLQRQLANLYVQMRGLDAQAQILGDSLNGYQQALKMTQDLYQGQIASELDLNRAQSELALAQAGLDDIRAQRNLAEHAMAELMGALPSDFSLAVNSQPLALPSIPKALPGSLLQRRPDVAAAERRVFAANAGIGVARAARYPDFSLTGLFGGQTMGVGSLLSSANRIWAIGPTLTLPIFDGGRLNAAEQQSRAEFDEASANYRGQVLKAVREVEDNLGQLRDLALESTDQQAAVDAAQLAQSIALNSFQAGAVSYLEVVTAQNLALQAQQHLELVKTNRLQASVGLVVALGGGWEVNQPGD